MKKIVEMHHFQKENMASFGYITDRQQAALCCIAELLEETAKTQGQQLWHGPAVYKRARHAG